MKLYGRRTVNDEPYKLWACFKVLFVHLSWVTKENHKDLSISSPWLEFEAHNFQVWAIYTAIMPSNASNNYISLCHFLSIAPC